MTHANEGLVDRLVALGLPWLQEQRDLHRRSARKLTKAETQALAGYYDETTLDTVTLAVVDKIANPPFYDDLTAAGTPTFDISGAAGMAFIDCVVVVKAFHDSPSKDSILFHELVHVVQFQILGPRRHLEIYLRGWVGNGFQYHRIPLEVQAQRLEARYNRHEMFSVGTVLEEELRGTL